MKAARVVDGIVTDVTEIPEGFRVEDCFVPEAGFIEAKDDAIVGGTFTNGKFGPPPKPEPPKWTVELLRDARNRALAECDWTQLPDVPEATREKFKSYRQALRDLPSKFSDEVRFPEPPK